MGLKDKIKKNEFLINTVRSTKVLIEKKKIDFRTKIAGVNVDPHKLLWINPNSIKKIGLGWGKIKKLEECGKVIDGDWDLNYMNFNELDIFKSFKAHFSKGKPWEGTRHYRSIVTRLKYGSNSLNIDSDSELSKRIKYWDNLYKRIEENGYISKREISDDSILNRPYDEITVRISRFGEIIFEDGRHRLSISKLLGLEKIPVLVTWRHKIWYNFRDKILNESIPNIDYKDLKLFLHHPDLDTENIPYQDQKFNIIKKYMPPKGGTVLELNTQWGKYSSLFTNEGYSCFALQKDKENYEFIVELKNVLNKKYSVVHCDLNSFHEKSNYDVVLLLENGIDEISSFNQLEQFFSRIKCKYFILELDKHKTVFEFDNDVLVEKIKSISQFADSKNIGEVSNKTLILFSKYKL